MEAIRRIQTVQNGEVYFQLPKQFWGQEVEIIVLPAPAQTMRLVMPKKSLRGCLKHYAKPELRWFPSSALIVIHKSHGTGKHRHSGMDAGIQSHGR